MRVIILILENCFHTFFIVKMVHGNLTLTFKDANTVVLAAMSTPLICGRWRVSWLLDLSLY